MLQVVRSQMKLGADQLVKNRCTLGREVLRQPSKKRNICSSFQSEDLFFVLGQDQNQEQADGQKHDDNPKQEMTVIPM